MNCKPGDLARIVTAGPFQDQLIVVTEVYFSPWGWIWDYEGPLKRLPNGDRQTGFFDHVLRPIRDPGDDAVDETLLRQPTPTKELA